MRLAAILLTLLVAGAACKPAPDEPPDAVEPQTNAPSPSPPPTPTAVQTAAQTTGAAAKADDEGPRPDQCPERKPADKVIGAAKGCRKDADCRSHVCGIFRDGATGECIDAPSGCATRMIGRVVDVTTMQPVPGAELIARHAYMKKLDSLVAVGESNDDGSFDFETDGEIEGGNGSGGVMMEASAPGYAPTRTFLMWKDRRANKYPAANRTRDIWLIPTETLKAWSTELAKVAPKELLPLGKKAATVVVTRNWKGEVIADATVESFREERTKSKVYYLQPDGSFGGEKSTEAGIAIILGASGGEDFGVGADRYHRCEVKNFLAVMSDRITVAGCLPRSGPK